jgi:predicted Zn-dependent protease
MLRVTIDEEDPFAVSLSEKVDLVTGVTRTMREVEGIAVSTAQLMFWDTDKWFVSSQGHRIFQHIVESGCGMDATAVGEAPPGRLPNERYDRGECHHGGKTEKLSYPIGSLEII